MTTDNRELYRTRRRIWSEWLNRYPDLARLYQTDALLRAVLDQCFHDNLGTEETLVRAVAVLADARKELLDLTVEKSLRAPATHYPLREERS